MSRHSVHATSAEASRRVPGDELIAEPIASLTHAITIRCSPAGVWPWLAQMGAGRAGWYSYDVIDNGGKPSADRIIPELQDVAVGFIFPSLPGATKGFIVLACEPNGSLVLGATGTDWTPLVTWAFVLDAQPNRHTRLLVRVRASHGYTFHGLTGWVANLDVPPGHFIMERKQLIGIAQRAEGLVTAAHSDSTRAASPAMVDVPAS